MGFNAVFGYALWAGAQDLVMHFGPEHKIWLCAMGQNAVCNALYMEGLVPDQLTERRSTQQFLKVCQIR
jgi:hypothetical protein